MLFELLSKKIAAEKKILFLRLNFRILSIYYYISLKKI